MKKGWNNQRVEENLRKLPVIQDKRPENELYQKVVEGLQEETDRKNKRSWKSWLIPSLATLAVLVLIAVIGQSAMRIDHFTSQEDAADTYSNEAVDTEEAKVMEEGSQSDSGLPAERSESADEGAIVNEAEEPVSKAVYTNTDRTTTLDVSIPIEGNGYLVPLTYQTENTSESIQSTLNQLDERLDPEAISLPPNLLQGVTFEIDKSNGIAIVHFPAEFNFEDEAFTENVGTVLSRLFLPLEINQVKLQINGKPGIPIATKGEVIDSLPLKQPGSYVYKIYQKQEDTTPFLAAVPVAIDHDIEAAFYEMRKEEPDNNLKATIPADVTFRVQKSEKQVSVDLSGPVTNDQKTLDMMEAMMMTAKSFGYKTIEFNIAENRIGPYDNLEEPLEVPDGINGQ
ncbi:hypothetical protein ERJ70_10490 [Sediminibacillus dalangtanensis]|uniref:Sporulation and spore germination n=1 Tax=Sediminibacillus dalangtanensis TaxID=2729421 RepID=A0ABX7VRX8_9BACI|nr:hypothetical protein [Sediminibacillus dalangtanensis]QTM99692.1 hypothetical protein ERJ70_10490 [Sediminibacillus dalangtanensis]